MLGDPLRLWGLFSAWLTQQVSLRQSHPTLPQIRRSISDTVGQKQTSLYILIYKLPIAVRIRVCFHPSDKQSLLTQPLNL